MTSHRVSVTLPAGRSPLNDKVPEVSPYTSWTMIMFQDHTLVFFFFTLSQIFVSLILWFPVSTKEASVTEK